MFSILLKKEMHEVWRNIFINQKTGEKKTKAQFISNLALLTITFGILLVVFFGLASMICDTMVDLGFDWFYFLLMGLTGVALGTFGSVFTTFATLYLPKDNELLLSMPIPLNSILLSRIVNVFLMGYMYEMFVEIPTIVYYFVVKGFSITILVTWFLRTLVIGLFILFLSCILGWFVALISKKTKNKSFVTLGLSLLFLGGYYYVYFSVINSIDEILLHLVTFATNVQEKYFLLYSIGDAACGGFKSLAIITCIVIALCIVVYVILSKSYLMILTTNKGEKKKEFTRQEVKETSASSALLKREFKHFISSANYMLNCGLGSLFLVAGAIALLWKGEMIHFVVSDIFVGYEGYVLLIVCAMFSMICCMNNITAPSVSLEGKSLYIIQSLPVDPYDVLKAKLNLHLIITLPPVALFSICTLYVLKFEIGASILVFIFTMAYTIFMALFGLAFGIRFANVNWTSETVAIKRSLPVFVSIFGGWASVIVLGFIYYLLRSFVEPITFITILVVCLAIADRVLLVWVKNRGTKLFMEL